MSSELGEKIKAIREAEGLSQAKFSDLTDISISTIKKYETGVRDPGGSTLLRITRHEKFKKYALWLMTDRFVRLSPLMGKRPHPATKAERRLVSCS